ncbi:hypothetical protein AKJ16_DCAP12204 [Drosera capensis]
MMGEENCAVSNYFQGWRKLLKNSFRKGVLAKQRLCSKKTCLGSMMRLPSSNCIPVNDTRLKPNWPIHLKKETLGLININTEALSIILHSLLSLFKVQHYIMSSPPALSLPPQPLFLTSKLLLFL